MLIKRKDRDAHRRPLADALARFIPWPRPPHLPAPVRPRRRRTCGARRTAARLRAQGQGWPAAAGRSTGHHPQKCLHALLGRLHGDRRGGERRLDRSGTRLGQPDQPRLALCQGRCDPRAGERGPPPALSAEARERRLDPHLLGSGHQRDRRQADGNSREVGAGLRSIGSAPRSSPTKAPISIASSRRSGEPTTPTIRRASVIPPPSPA